MSNNNETLVKGLAGLNVLTSIAMPKIWTRIKKNPRRIVDAIAALSGKGTIYLNTLNEQGESINIKAGGNANYEVIQTLEPGEHEVIVNVMQPNKDITAAQLDSLDARYGSSATEQYRKALKDNLVAVQFERLVDDSE